MTKSPSPADPGFESGTWTHQGVALNVLVVFSCDMDTAVTPANGVWEGIVDSVAKTPSVQNWNDSRTLSIAFAPITPAPTTVTLELLTASAGLRCFNGRPVQPFGPVVIPAA